jgi:hypothetical protein
MRGKVESDPLLCPREREWDSGALRPRGIGKQACPAREGAHVAPGRVGAGATMRTQSVRVLGA